MKGTILDFLKLAAEKPELGRELVELAGRYDFEFTDTELSESDLDGVAGGVWLGSIGGSPRPLYTAPAPSTAPSNGTSGGDSSGALPGTYASPKDAYGGGESPPGTGSQGSGLPSV